MRFDRKDVVIETKVGQGPGGQHRNKTSSCVVATHLPTGLSVTIDERNQHQNKRKAFKLLEQKFEEWKDEQMAARKKQRRDEAIKNEDRVRTYDFKSGLVTDHRSGKVASLKQVLKKGRLDLLQ